MGSPGKHRKYRQICCLGPHTFLSTKFVVVVLGLLAIVILEPDFQFFKRARRKLIQESGHPRIVLQVNGMKEKDLCLYV